MLAEFPIQETSVSPRGDYYGEKYISVKKYIDDINRHNKRCSNVLNLAISQGNESLAKRVIKLFKKNVDVYGDFTGVHIVISSKCYNYNDKEAAMELLDEAIREGAFKNSD